MRRGLKSITLAVFAVAFLVGGSLPAQAASEGVNCNTYASGAYSIKLCFVVYEDPDGQVGPERAQVNFCNWYPSDPCEATQLEFSSLRLRTESCSVPAGNWSTEVNRTDFQFDPRNFSNTHTDWGGEESRDHWEQTFADFRIKWPNGTWSSWKSAQSFKWYDDRNQSPSCPNRY